jgi:hypothetical protein
MAIPPAPQLLNYVTSLDEQEMRYTARYTRDLPDEALADGCLQEVTAATPEGLTQAAVRNRITIERWTSGEELKRLTVQAGTAEPRFTAGDPA